MRRRHLYVVAALIWGIPGVSISLKGINAYTLQSPESIRWLLPITVSVAACFFFMFRRIVDRYCIRMASLPEKVGIWQTFPLRGWFLLALMMALGITLKHLPQIPAAFTAAFYSGLGPMLMISSVRFLCHLYCPESSRRPVLPEN